MRWLGHLARSGLAVAALAFATAGPPLARDWYVAPDGRGTGNRSGPFGRIQDALDIAQPGDIVHVLPGTYAESLRTVRDGAVDRPVVVRASAGRGSVIVTTAGRVVTVAHAYHTLEGLVLDGQYGADDLVRVADAAHGFTLRNTEVRRTSRDGIDMGSPADVLIENSLIHHTLNAANGRTDAHGIVAGAARRLTIRNTEVHTFSGDAFQIDPGRAEPGWDHVTIEGCRFWLAPLPSAENGFAAGVVPGENGVDTKTPRSGAVPNLVIRNTDAFGFRDGLISNMAAFNIKERVNAVVDGVTVHASEIAFRLRAPANVRLQNAVVYDVATAVRYEDNIQGLRIWNSTFGAGIGRLLLGASSPRSVLDVQNVAVAGASLPLGIGSRSNLTMRPEAFVDPATHDYRLAANAPGVDRGVALSLVSTDRVGVRRPQGAAYDVGAYERESAKGPGKGRRLPRD
ncbi:MAG TPA: choice-of-anchor Q domain-containing protein [Vicinamibacterales bacterium]